MIEKRAKFHIQGPAKNVVICLSFLSISSFLQLMSVSLLSLWLLFLKEEDDDDGDEDDDDEICFQLETRCDKICYIPMS